MSITVQSIFNKTSNKQFTNSLEVIPVHNVECFSLIKLTPRAPAPLGCSPDRYPVRDP